MSIRRLSFLAATGLLLLFFLASCAGAPVRKVSEAEEKVFTRKGPDEGFKVTQTLSSITEVHWVMNVDGTREEKKRVAGLKILVTYSVTKREKGVATISADLKEIKILKENSFVNAPFTQFSPPNPIQISVDYGTGTVVFPGVSESFNEWAEGLKNTPVWDVMGESFNVEAFVEQLKYLLKAPIAEFSGKTLLLGKVVTEESLLYLPFMGPSLSIGPVKVTRKYTLRGALESGRGKIALIEGKMFSDELSMDATTLQRRFSIFGTEPREYYESEGELGGRYRARVEVDTGWILQDSRKIHSVTIIKFKDGTLKEEVFGRINIFETE